MSEFTKELTCPYCGKEQNDYYDLWEDFDEVAKKEWKCQECGEIFIPMREIKITYSSFKAKLVECDRCNGTKRWYPMGEKSEAWRCNKCNEDGKIWVEI